MTKATKANRSFKVKKAIRETKANRVFKAKKVKQVPRVVTA